MTPETSTAPDEAQIQNIVLNWADAVRSGDSAGLASAFSPDVLLFDLIDPLRYTGLDALQKRAGEWLASFQGPIGYDVEDLSITAGHDVAFCHSLNHVKGTTREGKAIDMWWRATVGFRKVNGAWIVTHEHSSVPFNMKTGKASLGLKP